MYTRKAISFIKVPAIFAKCILNMYFLFAKLKLCLNIMKCAFPTFPMKSVAFENPCSDPCVLSNRARFLGTLGILNYHSFLLSHRQKNVQRFQILKLIQKCRHNVSTKTFISCHIRLWNIHNKMIQNHARFQLDNRSNNFRLSIKHPFYKC